MTPTTTEQNASHTTHLLAPANSVVPGIDLVTAVGLIPITEGSEFENLLARASVLRDLRGHGQVTYSPKVFIPLTKLCRDVCHYCTFAQPPRRGERAYLNLEEVLQIARAGVAAGCREALFTLGDKPELRYAVARNELAEYGHQTTISYLAEVAGIVLKETGLLPHINAGVVTEEELAKLRKVSPSQGIMLESTSPRLGEKGQPHYGSPDKSPERRLATIEAAGRLSIPFTTGILIGIGETREERIDALFAIADLHARYGHIQEVIVQNFRAKPGTKMADYPEPSLDDHLWTIAVARLILGSEVHIQAPPNLTEDFGRLLDAGIDDWGGISPVTLDHVNPEAPWPELEQLASVTESRGLTLLPRLTTYPEYVKDATIWLDEAVTPAVLELADGANLSRDDSWFAGITPDGPELSTLTSGVVPTKSRDSIIGILERAVGGDSLTESQIVRLFQARGGEVRLVTEAANELRQAINGDEVTYVVNRNINYTNVCSYHCQFCAFSKGKLAENLRGKSYLLPLEEIVRRSHEAWARGATEVCLQGGIHPDFTGEFYLEVLRAIKTELPTMHVHAFSPLEVSQGARTLGLKLEDYLAQLRDAGLGSLPGTAAEILDDDIRAIICPDKLNTAEWVEVIETAHRVGLPTTSTIMFGHVEGYDSWARHLLVLRGIQERTGGITEFVPLPFVHLEAPLYLKGRARRGPTYRESILMHGVSRLALNPLIHRIQASWVKLGPTGAAAALQSGANDMGGTLMNESISRAAGAGHGEELSPEEMETIIHSVGRNSKQRTTLYRQPPVAQVRRSFGSPPLSQLSQPTDLRLFRAV
ncbi:MAG TPA: 5-amino-6-(D-ribitylamino)uracil--L-tyrosine 4-hydroxyphenyl transferase CofH [Candidatus Nanopelagicaceae bacterium]|nr:5-amino-6-(D-ribitylamino)uracil--L-tyrosine 4-hydroxyphenyl transferase CofH [Candidatus Nanopelagicaceae bacterium]